MKKFIAFAVFGLLFSATSMAGPKHEKESCTIEQDYLGSDAAICLKFEMYLGVPPVVIPRIELQYAAAAEGAVQNKPLGFQFIEQYRQQ